MSEQSTTNEVQESVEEFWCVQTSTKDPRSSTGWTGWSRSGREHLTEESAREDFDFWEKSGNRQNLRSKPLALAEMINRATDQDFHQVASLVEGYITANVDDVYAGFLVTSLAYRAHALMAQRAGEEGRLSRWVLAVLSTEPPVESVRNEGLSVPCETMKA